MIQRGMTIPVGNSDFEGRIPLFKASDYVKHIASRSGEGPCTFLAALMYMERLKVLNPWLFLSSSSMRRLLLVAVMTAAKYLEDKTLCNADW